ncbi:MipA/OmpV family protein [Acidovorax sp. SUPP2539]|uniref:MipA/OmpV family protein n=1 Tax=Acidovorax sp. SUPP2539 TaxID=2920878 RepID=UPI0023DE4DC4|nr:MipA/OmpV family protein [Acidovorax sp. SUPP2539]GKS92729.1 MipA/OmpV family protein [Acidovorax sp. SUPP2539]
MKPTALRLAPCLLASVFVAMPHAGHAQTLAGWGSRLLGDTTDFSIGAAARVTPRYPGSDDHRVEILPVLSVQRGIFFADTSRGIGLQWQSESGFYASQSVFYDFGRVQRNSPFRPGSRKLAGLGDVPDSVTTRTLLMQQFTPDFSVSAEAEFALESGARRNRYRLGAEYNLLKTSADTVSLSADVHAGDRRYNQAYFGVTPQQASRTRFAAFNAGSGVYGYAIGASWSHALAPHWTTSLQVSALRYVDNAEHSPLVVRRTSVTGGAAVTYTY